MLFTIALIGMFVVVATCRHPNIGYWKGFSIKQRKVRLTSKGSKLYLTTLCLMALGLVVWYGPKGESTRSSSAPADKVDVTDAVKPSAQLPAAPAAQVQAPQSTPDVTPTKITRSILNEHGAQFRCLTSSTNFGNSPDWQPLKQLWTVGIVPSAGKMRIYLDGPPPVDEDAIMYRLSAASDDLIRGTNPLGLIATLNPQTGAIQFETLDGKVGMIGTCDRTY